MARLRARTFGTGLQQEGQRPLFRAGGLSVDLVARIVKIDGLENQALAARI